MASDKKNLRRVSMLITAQTKTNLERLAAVAGYREIGRVVDKLTREKMLALHHTGKETLNNDRERRWMNLTRELY